MNKPTFKHICLMHIQQLTNFPYIEKDFDALTDYGLLCKVVDYLNQVIANENAQNDNILALYNAFTELKNYVENFFDNLDVQDEINNKLDEMAESGTLDTLLINVFTSAQSIARDTLFDNIEDAFKTCLENKYILYLTKDYEILNDLEQLNIPSIIGNGHTINYDGQGLVGENVNIQNVIFENNTGSITNGYCLRLTNSNIENCDFKNYVSPLLISGEILSSVKNCNFYNCSQGVYTTNAKNVTIDGISFINTEAQRNSYISSLITTTGKDGVLVENSDNIHISNSYFKYCIERILYSSDSDNVTINNCVGEYCDPFKFVGYTQIRNNFSCNNNIVYNAFDDAYVQLYHCKNIDITDNIFNCDNDSSCLGWFVRAGHNISNININGNKAYGIKRSFLDYEDVFPNTIVEANYNFSNVTINNNYANRLSLISGNHLPIINIKDDSTVTAVTKSNITINNNTFMSRNYDNKDTWTTGNYSCSELMHCTNGDLITIKNNNVKGIYNSDHTLPLSTLTNSTHIMIEENVYRNDSQLLTNINTISGIANVRVNYTDENVFDGYADYEIHNSKYIADVKINQHGTIFLKIPKTLNLNLSVLNVDEFIKLGIYNQLPIVDGTKVSTTLANQENYIYLYDTDDGNITLRTRSTRTLQYTGLISKGNN